MSRILVIDDDEMVRSMLKRSLERAGYEVIATPNGRKALQILREVRCDLVITDILMPEQDGLETILEVRKEFPSSKIIAISGGGRFGDLELLKDSQLFGAERIFTKPVEPELLMAAIAELLAA